MNKSIHVHNSVNSRLRGLRNDAVYKEVAHESNEVKESECMTVAVKIQNSLFFIFCKQTT